MEKYNEAKHKMLEKKISSIREKIDNLIKKGEKYNHLRKLLLKAENLLKNNDEDGCNNILDKLECLLLLYEAYIKELEDYIKELTERKNNNNAEIKHNGKIKGGKSRG